MSLRAIATPSGFVPDFVGMMEEAALYIFAERGSLCACGHFFHYHADCPSFMRPLAGGPMLIRDYVLQSTGCCTEHDCPCSEFVDIRTVEKYRPWLERMKIPFIPAEASHA